MRFVAPWGEWPIAAAALTLAAIGFVFLVLRDRRALLLLVIAFGPYLVFDLLFQETITTRYALPLVVPVGYLRRARGVAPAAPRRASSSPSPLIAASVYVSDRHDVRLLARWRRRRSGCSATCTTPCSPKAQRCRPRRSWRCTAARTSTCAGPSSGWATACRRSRSGWPTPPKHEWLEVVKYWNSGGREPVWFIADPLRSDLALFNTRSVRSSYRWPFASTDPDWRCAAERDGLALIESPDWYLGEGWALTPETAGTAREDRTGPGLRRRSGMDPALRPGR